MKAFWNLLRPFTLVAPIIGIVSGVVLALGVEAAPLSKMGTDLAVPLIWVILSAACLNNGSNLLNQVTDLEIDRVNKPDRPLVTGAISVNSALKWSILFYLLALVFAWLGSTRADCAPFWIVTAGLVLTLAYSVPPIRTKKHGTLANVTIALARGCLLPVCGWAVALPPDQPAPWAFGGVCGMFIFGAAATKDFADAEGDALHGCETWVVKYGATQARNLVAPFLFFPWILMGLLWGFLPQMNPNGNLNWTYAAVICFLLTVYGFWISRLMGVDSKNPGIENNHRSWLHIYLLYQMALFGIPLSYHFSS